jgi:hypothetical protein
LLLAGEAKRFSLAHRCHTFPLIPRRDRVVIVSSVITKIFNPLQVLDGHISTFLMTLLFNQCLLLLLLVPVIYSSTLFSYSLFDSVVHHSYCSVNRQF